MIDGYLRSNQVYHLHKAGNPEWKKQAFVQGASFVAGVISGVAIGMFFAPALGGIVLTLAAAGAVGIITDQLTQSLAAWGYDKLN